MVGVLGIVSPWLEPEDHQPWAEIPARRLPAGRQG